MNLLSILLQATTTAASVTDSVRNIVNTDTITNAANKAAIAPADIKYFDLLLKGGPILIPIGLLFILSIYIIIERSIIITRANKKDKVWLSRVDELIEEGKIDKASLFCASTGISSAQVIKAGLDEISNDVSEIQETMQAEAGIEINRLEKRMNYLGIISSVAPMLGFIGTIWGVIMIFVSISAKGSLDIAGISEGLYQKMICSGAGLFVGIIAYTGFYILNGYIDRAVHQMDKDTNEIIKSIRKYKKNPVVVSKSATAKTSTPKKKAENNED